MAVGPLASMVALTPQVHEPTDVSTDAAVSGPSAVDNDTAFNPTPGPNPIRSVVARLAIPAAAVPAPSAPVIGVSTTPGVTPEASVSRRLSTLLPDSFGELLSGGLLLVRRTPGRTAAPAAATAGTSLASGQRVIAGPAAGVATSASLGAQGTLTIRAVGAANVALSLVAPAQIAVVQGKQTLGTFLVGSVQRVEFIGSNGNDVFNGAAINKPMTITGNGGNDTLTGGGDRDTIYGNDGIDVIYGNGGVDTIFGGTGTDVISGGADGDTIDGEAGNDSILGDAGDDTLIGGADNDTINAGPGLDTLYGDAGNDTLNGDDGNDTIAGGAGDDAINGGFGDDTIDGLTGNDRIDGGADNDRINAGADNDTVYGGAGADTLSGGDGIDTMQGDAGADTINGDGGNDLLYGDVPNELATAGAGNDVINGGDGNDSIQGNAGNDILNGNNNDDTIEGGYGNDFLDGGANNDVLRDRGGGSDTINGGDGDDTIEDGCTVAYGCAEAGAAPVNVLLGGRGVDNITSGWGNNTIRGDEGNDTITGTSASGVDTIYGDAGSDVIRGGPAGDTIFGGADPDTIWGDGGNDSITGDTGNDTLNGGADNDTIFGGADNDNLNGDAGQDTLNGDAGNDTLRGGADDDTLNGGADNDQMYGDAGNDRLSGEAGADALWGGENVDFLLGGPGSDQIYGDGGNDTLNGNGDSDALYGGAGDDWLVSLDGIVDQIEGGAGRDSFWRDGNGDAIRDFVAADDADNAVARFANGADITLDGDRIQRPAAGTWDFAAYPLFPAAGPSGSDVRVLWKSDTMWGAQLAALAAGADRPGNAMDPSRSWLIRRAMVDFGDGTYGLKLGGSYYRVDSALAGSAQGPSYVGFGAGNSIWPAIAMKGIVTALSGAGALNYGVLSGPSMNPTTVFALFAGGDVQRNPRTTDVAVPMTPATLNDALDLFRRGGSYLTVSLADSADAALNGGLLRLGTLGSKFDTFYANPDYTPRGGSTMVYSVSSVETSGGQITAVILRNPTGVDTGDRDACCNAVPVSYRDANPNDGLVRITVAELLTSGRGFRLSWLPTGR